MRIMRGYLESVLAALEAITFHAPAAFSWLGGPPLAFDPPTRPELAQDTTRQLLVHNLQLQLYYNFYCRGVASPGAGFAVEPRPAGVAAFVERLSAANTGTGSLQAGWGVRKGDARILIVDNGELEIRVPPEACTLRENSSDL